MKKDKVRLDVSFLKELSQLDAGSDVANSGGYVAFWIFDKGTEKYLTIADIDPNCRDSDDDKIAKWGDVKSATNGMNNYLTAMRKIGIIKCLRIVGITHAGRQIPIED